MKYTVRYAHLSQVFVKLGQALKEGGGVLIAFAFYKLFPRIAEVIK